MVSAGARLGKLWTRSRVVTETPPRGRFRCPTQPRDSQALVAVRERVRRGQHVVGHVGPQSCQPLSTAEPVTGRPPLVSRTVEDQHWEAVKIREGQGDEGRQRPEEHRAAEQVRVQHKQGCRRDRSVGEPHGDRPDVAKVIVPGPDERLQPGNPRPENVLVDTAVGQVPGSGARLRVPSGGSGGQCGQVVASDLGVEGGDDVDAAAGQDVEAEVAPTFGPFVGLLGQHGADQAHDRGPVGE